MKLLFILILFCVALDFSGFSQNESAVNYTTKDGLPSSQVYDVIQDDFGYLWFSTDKGLSRYDGYEFRNFNTSHGLAGNVVFEMIKRPDGTIWATTNSSTLFHFSGANPTFTLFKFNHLIEKHASNKVINGLYFSDEGDLYIGFNDNLHYLRISKSGEVVTVPYRIDDKPKKGYNVSISLVKDDDSDPFFYVEDFMRVGSSEKLNNLEILSKSTPYTSIVSRFEAVYFDASSTAVLVFNDTIQILRNNQTRKFGGGKDVIASGKIGDNHFWLGYRYGGIRVYNLSGQIVNAFLNEKSGTKLFIDQDGHYWISTLEEGVFMIRNQSMKFLRESGNKRINSLATGINNDVFIGCYDGKIFNRDSNGRVNLYFESDRSYQPVHFARNKHINQLFISSGHTFDLDRKIYDNVHTNYISIVDDRYLTNGTFGVRTYDLATGQKDLLFGKMRTNDLVSYKGALYAASIFGLYKSKVNAEQDDYKLVLKNLRVDDLEVFGEYLVLGTNGDGLMLIDETLGTKYHIEKRHGLTSNYVTKIYQENDSTLWIGTNKGVNRIAFDFKQKKYKIQKLDVREGLAGNEVWDVVVNQDTVWIATQRGLNFISKNDFFKVNDRLNSYFLQWKSMKVNDEFFVNVHAFDYDQNKLEFGFLGISFIDDKDLIYQYKLLGLSNEWSYTNNRQIEFSSLPPGEYELIVKVRSLRRARDENEIRYAFTIHSPYWQTWWFISICIILVVAIVYLFFKIRVLTYNRDVVREIMRYVLQKLRRKEPVVIIRENGKDVRIKTGDIHYVKTSGNYLEIILKGKSHLVRSSISKFMKSLPDEIEFIQVHRSYIVRIDKVQQKGKGELVVLETTIPIGRVYTDQLKLIEL